MKLKKKIEKYFVNHCADKVYRISMIRKIT